MTDCSSIQRSLAWCQGKPELPGVKRRIYYISKYDILEWPVLQHDANGRLKTATYSGEFVLRADAKWKFIDILPDKSQLTSEAQGEYPSQTQLNKLVAVHPGVDLEASAAAAYLNNNDNVFLVEDMRGAFRVVGSDKWPTKTTVAQDLGQGATGTTSTTINVEATDECPAPFYNGVISSEVGDTTGTSSSGSGSNSGSGSGSGSSSGSGSGSSTTSVYNNIVKINGSNYSVTNGGTVNIEGYMTSLQFTGSNMEYIGYQRDNNMEEEIDIASNGTSASWSGMVSSPALVKIYKIVGPDRVLWFKINLTGSSTGGDGGDDLDKG